MRTPLVSGLGLLLAVTASAQEQPQLKARELFYTPITETKPTPAKETPSKAAVVKPPKPKPGPAKHEGEAEHQASHKPQSATSPDGTRVQNATLGEVVGPPLALKYRLLKRSDEGRYDEVDTDTVFRSGDKIRVSVESNDHGYLYIVQQGSSKTWNLLFPNRGYRAGQQSRPTQPRVRNSRRRPVHLRRAAWRGADVHRAHPPARTRFRKVNIFT